MTPARAKQIFDGFGRKVDDETRALEKASGSFILPDDHIRELRAAGFIKDGMLNSAEFMKLVRRADS